MKSLFITGLEMMGIPFTGAQLGKLLEFYNELSVWNRGTGFVKAEGRDLVVRHFFDSLAPLGLLASTGSGNIADAGSGAGFPGIPLSILMPDNSFTLIERSAKRALFLQSCKMLFSLENVKVAEGELENVREKFDCAVFRAFRNFPEYASRLSDILSDNGILFAYKGRRSEAEAEMGEAGITKYRVERISVPFMTEERHIVITGKGDISLRTKPC